MSQRRVCDFYNRPQGCRHGANCRFLHEPHGTSGPLPTFTPCPPQNPRPDNAPKGLCRVYWNGGTCRRVNCWFNHIRSDEAPSASPSVADSRKSQPPTTSIAPGSSENHSFLKPGEAKYQLSTIFLKPGFRFGLPSTVNRFVMILASCSVANNWVLYLHSYLG